MFFKIKIPIINNTGKITAAVSPDFKLPLKILETPLTSDGPSAHPTSPARASNANIAVLALGQ